MKIHPNYRMNEMLNNGSARIIDYKFPPYRYLDRREYTYENLPGPSSAEEKDDNRPDRSAQEAAPITEIFEVSFPPSALEDEDGQAFSQNIPFETVQLTDNENDLSEEVPPAAILDIPGSDVPAILDVPSSDAPSATLPGVITKVIQPESAQGGLIAEIHFEGDPSGLVFGTLPGYVSCASAIGPAQSVDYGLAAEDSSYPPYISFIAFNRLGLTMKNLSNLLDSDEDFELNIIDCNSKDNSWEYIQSLNDRRIKSRIHFDKNVGPIFATNFALRRRKPYQYFIVIDSDTFIKTKKWIARFMEVFNAFPEVGLLGLMRDNPYPKYLPPIIPRVNGPIVYLQLQNADINSAMDFVPGQLQCLRPGLIEEIGYWSEENGFGDAEISPRITHYTNYTVGFITTIEIDMTQRIACEECMGQHLCTLNRSTCDCFMLCRLYNKNELFVEKNTWKFKQTFQELKEGHRTAYCASIHDPESVKMHEYHADWAYDNFNHYIINAN